MALENKNNVDNSVSSNASDLADKTRKGIHQAKNAKKNIAKAKKVGKKALDIGKKIVKILQALIKTVSAAFAPVMSNILVILLILVIVVAFVETIVSSIFGFSRNEIDYNTDTYEQEIEEHCKTSRNDVQTIIDGYYWDLIKDINSKVKDFAVSLDDSVITDDQANTLNDAENLSVWGVDWNTADSTRFDNYTFEYSGYNENSQVKVEVSPSLSTFSNTLQAYLEAKYTTIKQVEDITNSTLIEQGKKEKEMLTKYVQVMDSEELEASLECANAEIRDETGKCYLKKENGTVVYVSPINSQYDSNGNYKYITNEQCEQVEGETVENWHFDETTIGTACKYEIEKKEEQIEEFEVNEYKSLIKQYSGFLTSDYKDWDYDSLTYGTFEIENPDYEAPQKCEYVNKPIKCNGSGYQPGDTCYGKTKDYTEPDYPGHPECTKNSDMTNAKGEPTIEITGVKGTIYAYISLDTDSLDQFMKDEETAAIKALASALYNGDQQEAYNTYQAMFEEELAGITELCGDEDIDFSMLGYANFTEYAKTVGAVTGDIDWSQFAVPNGATTNDANTTTEIAKRVWGVILGEGGSGTSRPQCTMYVKAMFMDTYPELRDSYPGGNGYQVAKNIINTYPDRFYDGKISQSKVEVKAGSVVSVNKGGEYYSSAGHVAFINEVHEDYLIISDGNYGSKNLARVYRTISWTEWETKWLPYINAIAVPK